MTMTHKTEASGTKSSTLSPYIKSSYFGADLTFMFMVGLTNTYAQIFLTDVALFPAAIAGSILFFGRILDTISTPPIGLMIEKSNLKWGKYRPWLVIGSILTLVFNILFFINWDGSSGSALMKAVICCLVYAAFCASTNIVYTGFTSLNSALTTDPQERVKLSSLRGQGGSLGKILAGYLLIPMIYFFGNSDHYTNKGLLITAILTSTLLVIGYCNLANAVKGKDSQQMAAAAKTTAQKIRLRDNLNIIITNRPLMCLFCADIMRILANLIVLSIFPYFFQYVAKDVKAIPMLFGSISISMLVGATLIRYITRFLSKRNTYVLGLIILCISFVIANLLKDNTYLMVGALVVGFTGYSFSNTVTTAMYADIVDYGEVKYGKNTRAIYFSMFQLSIKIAAIFSTAIAGFGLAATGYIANTEPTLQVISGINFISLALPLIACIISTILLFLYNLSDKKMESIRAELYASKN